MELIVLYIILFVPVIGIVWGVATLLGLWKSGGVPFVPLTRFQLANIKRFVIIPAEAKVVDLGCGDGRVLRLFEKHYGLASPVGYEINFWAYWETLILNKLKKSSAKVYCRDFFNEDLSGYDVVFCYLFPSCLARLKEKFDRELKPGAKVISYAFEVKEWRQPEIIYCDPDNHNISRIFIYTI